jgi:hypothetical protein
MAAISELFVKIGSEFDAKGINNATAALRKIEVMAVAMGAALVAAGVLAVKAASQSEDAQNALAQAMKNAGTYTKETYNDTVA